MKFTKEDRSVSVTVTYDLYDQTERVTLGRRNSSLDTTSTAIQAPIEENSSLLPCGDIQIEVKDEGIGLDEQQLSQVFGEGIQFQAGRAMQHGGGCKFASILCAHSSQTAFIYL